MGPGVKEKLALQDFSIFSSGIHLVYRSGTILAILVGSYLGNIFVKFESYWRQHLQQVIYVFLFLALVAILFIGAELF